MWFSAGKVRRAGGKTCWGLYELCAAVLTLLWANQRGKKKLLLVRRMRSDLLSHGFIENREEIYFLHLFCAPGSESWLGRAAILDDEEMCCVCHTNESNLAVCGSRV